MQVNQNYPLPQKELASRRLTDNYFRLHCSEDVKPLQNLVVTIDKHLGFQIQVEMC